LGIGLIFAGIVLGERRVVATIISAIFIGIAAIITGGFEIVHADGADSCGRYFLGILYLAFGLVPVSRPVSGTVLLTYVLGLLLFVSGLVHIFSGCSHPTCCARSPFSSDSRRRFSSGWRADSCEARSAPPSQVSI
jgi:uncharacterized membrane protein HdeD (DUF308 family)